MDEIDACTCDVGAALSAIQLSVVGLREENQGLNTVIDRLHSDNETLRRGEARKVFDPVIRDLIKLGDDWRRRSIAYQDQDDTAAATLCGEAAEDAGMILDRLGVRRFEPSVGDPFDRREHHAVGTEHTGEPTEDGTVAEIRAAGYSFDGRVIRFADVVVRRAPKS